MRIKLVTCSNGTTQYHSESCSHTAPYADGEMVMDFNATNMKELFHEINLDFNQDFASDYDMTVEEYVASRQGYEASFDTGSVIQVFRCVKF
jgi:hypothetical protein